MPFNHYVLLITFSMIVTLILCLNARKICISLNLLDIPGDRKIHKRDTPLMGGIALLFAFVPFMQYYVHTTASERWFPSLLIWCLCISAMTLIGIADDRHSLSPRVRLVASFGVFGAAAALDPTFNVRLINLEFFDFTIGLGTGWLAVIFTSICCVGLVNAVNMADGKNGLAIGLSLGWLGMAAWRAPDALLMPILLLASVLIILLIFNMMGRLFLGDGGAYGIATAVGLLAIMVYNTPGDHALRAISADELILLFIVPVFDSFRLTYVRMKRGQSPMSPDRDHLHHHLQNWFGWPGGLFIYLIIAIAPMIIINAIHL